MGRPTRRVAEGAGEGRGVSLATSNSKIETTAPHKPNVGEGPLLVRG
ncbi:MAG: hypothetical protein ACK55Z_15060 [bacterium]